MSVDKRKVDALSCYPQFAKLCEHLDYEAVVWCQDTSQLTEHHGGVKFCYRAVVKGENIWFTKIENSIEVSNTGVTYGIIIGHEDADVTVDLINYKEELESPPENWGEHTKTLAASFSPQVEKIMEEFITVFSSF